MLTSVAFAALLSSSSGGLLSGYQSQHVRFIDVPAEIGGRVVGSSKYATPGLETMSLEQLQAERLRLEDERPGIAVPIVLIVVGAVAAAIGYGVVFGSVVAGLIIFSAGAAALIAGTVWLIVNLVKRGKLSRDLTYVDSLIRTRSYGAPPGQPIAPPGQQFAPPSDVPPPPPAPPGGVFAPVPAPQFELAAF